MTTRFMLSTFGCKTNQYESQAVRERLLAGGFSETLRPSGADVLVVNTCGVTGRAGASCRRAVRRALRENPRLLLALTGCAVDLGEKWLDAFGGAALRVPNGQKHALADLLAARLNGESPPPPAGDGRLNLSISSFAGHTRAFVKIQDGCDNFCSYCAVPAARGAPASRPAADILAEAERLADNGYPELVLTGINIGAYRHDGLDLAGLAGMLAKTPGLVRLRLGSVEPPLVTDALLDAMAGDGRICPHLHIPLQSGDDRILEAMNRRHDAAGFMRILDRVRRKLTHPSVTSDVIVGFPGEDARAFENSLELCRRAAFSRLHVFLFSGRPGTPAATLPGRRADAETEKDKKRMIALGEESARNYAAGCVGLGERLIIEKSEKPAAGLTDRYVRARLADGRGENGETAAMRVTDFSGGWLLGTRIDAAST